MPKIVVRIDRKFKPADVNTANIKKLVKYVCRRFGTAEKPGGRYEINIALIDDTRMQQLNRRFLNHNGSTDVISFDLSGEDIAAPKSFDLAVNAEMAVRQAKPRGHSSEAEVALYITHGLLHNLGFNDSKQLQAEKMHETEDEILQHFGYGLVYNGDTEG